MAERIIGMRTALRENLENLGSPLSWEHITNQVVKLTHHSLLLQCCYYYEKALQSTSFEFCFCFCYLQSHCVLQTDRHVLL